jgi:RNA polymerase sigma factor (TIGR02999 family)
MSDVTLILSEIERGDVQAAERLLPLVYGELRKLATARMAQENPGQTLEATALVHEAYLRLVHGNVVPHWNSRGHFFGAAAEAMRRILVDNARRKRRPRHGGDRQRVELDQAAALADDCHCDILAVDEALKKLAEESPEKATLVKLRYFAGMSLSEASESLGISRATASRYWAYAKVFLYCAIEDAEQT